MSNDNSSWDVPKVPKSPPKLNARGQPYQAGDLILDRYMPNATNEEREAARANLKRFYTVVYRIGLRLATEECERDLKALRKKLNEFESP